MEPSDTPILDELVLYAHRCIDDVRITDYEDYISGKKHKWACQRLIRDIQRSQEESCWFYWDETEAKKIIEWFALLRHSKGELAGKPIILTPWQKFRLCQLYGWRRKENGRRRFRKSFTEVARKNAKSQEEAGVALYEMAVTPTKNGEVAEGYTAGTKRDQSKVVFKEMGLMLKGSPLQSKFRVTKASVRHIRTGSETRPLSKDDGKTGDGSNPAILVLDEYHQHRTTEFYDLGLGSNSVEPLLMIITTAGKDLTYPCYTIEYKYCSKVLDPDNLAVEDDEYLIDILELDPEDYQDLRNLDNERLWHKANPIRMSYEGGVVKIRGDYKIAREQTEHMNSFLTKCMDVWVQARDGGYMDMAKWAECQVEPEDIPDTTGWPVYVGFDMSAKIDLTSVAFVLPFQAIGTTKYLVYGHSFIPSREKLAERCLVDKVPYDDWERRGFISVTETPIVDQGAVMRYVLDTCRQMGWKIQCLCFDPANASKLMLDLSNEGYDVEEVFQSHKSLNESTQGFREQVYCGNIIYPENPVLTYAMSNAIIKRSNGLIKVDKDASTRRIDPVDATLGAYKLAMYHDFSTSIEEGIDAYIGG